MPKGTYHKRPAGAGVTISPAGASVSTQLSSDYDFIHVVATAAVHILFGATAPTATATSACLKLQANTDYLFPINRGEYIAAIGTADVEIHYME